MFARGHGVESEHMSGYNGGIQRNMERTALSVNSLSYMVVISQGCKAASLNSVRSKPWVFLFQSNMKIRRQRLKEKQWQSVNRKKSLGRH